MKELNHNLQDLNSENCNKVSNINNILNKNLIQHLFTI
jgi:hypothetical protein